MGFDSGQWRIHSPHFRFQQADDSPSRLFGGAGLGLPISKAYVELLGGRMWLKSEVGIGTQFYFTIPYKSD
ncbi:MAG: ATP-binding protein [Porphyromonadaceae bacterium]|nr:MAG: ATP-binding protein [Porphyromonadaceae bacterium]